MEGMFNGIPSYQQREFMKLMEEIQQKDSQR
jgi:hypothetical protein